MGLSIHIQYLAQKKMGVQQKGIAEAVAGLTVCLPTCLPERPAPHTLTSGSEWKNENRPDGA